MKLPNGQVNLILDSHNEIKYCAIAAKRLFDQRFDEYRIVMCDRTRGTFSDLQMKSSDHMDWRLHIS